MRIYNKWYEEVWFWVQENTDWILTIGIGVLLSVGLFLSVKYFLGCL